MGFSDPKVIRGISTTTRAKKDDVEKLQFQ
jgi:hypothetical protein